MPAVKFAYWPRIPVDTADGSLHHQLTTLGRRPAHEWITGPDGPYSHAEQSMAQTIRGIVGTALLHLMELGLIDVDVERLNGSESFPWGLTDVRPAPAPPSDEQPMATDG